jgi:hypothetical protein
MKILNRENVLSDAALLSRKSRRFGLLLAVFLSMATASWAANYDWIGDVDANYETLGNYRVGGVVPAALPGVDDRLTIGGTKTITSTATSTVHSLNSMYLAEGGKVSFDYNGNTLQIANDNSNELFRTSIRGSMTWENGTLEMMSSYDMLLGANNPQTSPVDVHFTGTGATFTSGNGFLRIGAYVKSGVAVSTTTLTIDKGAKLNSKTIHVGSNTSSVATLNVYDAGSVADLRTSNIMVGNGVSSSGTVHIKNGGEIKGITNFYLGNNTGSKGALIVEGTNSKLTATAMFVDAFPSGSISATLETRSGGEITINGNLTANRNAVIDVGATSRITSQNFYLNQNNLEIEKTATLMGSGALEMTVAGAHNINLYGVVKPGDSLNGKGVGTLTLGLAAQSAVVKLSNNSSFTFDFNSASDYDRIAIFGTLSQTISLGDLVLDFTNFTGGENPTQYTLFTTTEAMTGAFNSVTWIGATGSIYYGPNSIYITSAIPEPSLGLLLLFGFGLAGIWRRHQSGNGCS